ncbi:MAG: M20/M25/M40 family metallo-hydrolase [Candidatus Thermoplasmatota archaeon]|nr:M20/M25/M40 family metallo-hydrolase [Candidatus Thermoplasmatota archaeon]
MEHELTGEEQDEAVELTKQLIRIPSSASDGAEIYDHVEAYLREHGLEPAVQDIENPYIGYMNYAGQGHHNLYARIGNGQGPKIMLNGHLDTVGAHGEWFYPPHEATEEDGNIYGLGACDMKGGCAAAVTAVLALLERRDEINGELLLSFVFGEESPFSLGADTLLREHDLDGYDLIMVAEPAPALGANSYCYTHKRRHTPSFPVPVIGAEGRVVYELEFFGESSHASHPDGGINALEDAAQLISTIKDFDMFSNIKMGRGHYVVLNITGGDQTFTVPGYCKILVNRQLTLGEDEETATEELQQIIERLNLPSRVSVQKRFSPAPELEYTPYISESSEYIDRFVDLLPEPGDGGDKCRFTTTSVGDFNIYAARTGVPTLVFGPGGDNIHAPNEYVHRQDVVDTAAYFLAFFMDVF